MKNKQTSDFGKGFIYPIFLFAKHFERDKKLLGDGIIDYSLWFYAAADHMFEVEVPARYIGTKLGTKAEKLVDDILSLRLPMNKPKATKKDFIEVFERLEDLMLEIDKELGGEPIRAKWN